MLGCGATDVLVGDAPGLARIVAGIAGVTGDFNKDSIFTGDAITLPLGIPADVAAQADGSFYFSDVKAQRIGFVTAAGIVSWPVGRGLCGASVPIRDAATICLLQPGGLALEPAGTLLITDLRGHRVFRYDPSQATIAVVLGTGAAGEAAAGDDAASAPTNYPMDVAVGPDGSIYVPEMQNNRVIRVTPAGSVVIVAGDGTFGDSGDNGPATAAHLALPEGVAMLGDTLYIADTGNSRIRRVIGGTIQSYAGVGAAGFSGDGHAASLALFDHPARLAAATGLLFVTDRGNRRVRLIRVGPDSITTFSGTGSVLPGPDLAEAGRTPIAKPSGLATAGRAVFIVDADQYVIRRVVR